MDYDTARRYSHNASLSFPHYYYSERNSPLAVSRVSRTDPRGCPIGGLRGRDGIERDDGTMENGQVRRRIAVACARCRKRKIRCSGDPGDGSGCRNCKQAGVDTNQCQFHRVGSNDAYSTLASLTMAMGSPNAMMPIYNAAGSPFYARAVSASQYPQLDTRPVFPHTWTIPYSEETSPIETYNLDQPAAYMPNQSTMTHVYDESHRWNQSTRRAFQSGANVYLEPDTPMTPSYTPHGLPYIQTNLRAAVTSEAYSPLSMTSLHLTLPISSPQKPHPRQTQGSEAVPQRKLPFPQRNPAQSSRNVVDQLQDQRLRSAQVMGGPSMNGTGTYAKPAMAWNTEPTVPGAQGNTATDAPSGELMAQATSSATLSGVVEGVSVMQYMPVTTSANEGVAAPSSPPTPQQQLNFSTSSVLDSMPTPAPTATYSNFRNYSLPTSSSTEQLSLLASPNSNNNLYSFSTDNASKRSSLGEPSNEATLVSGQRYTPLSQSQSQHAANLEVLRRDSFEDRTVSLHRASMSNLNRSC